MDFYCCWHFYWQKKAICKECCLCPATAGTQRADTAASSPPCPGRWRRAARTDTLKLWASTQPRSSHREHTETCGCRGCKSVATCLNQYRYNSRMWLPGNCGFADSHKGIPKWNKLTFAPGRPCECLWTTPWGGRFFLWSGLKIPCSADNWGMDAVSPEEPHRNFLKKKQHSLIDSFFPTFFSVGKRHCEKSSNISCFCTFFRVCRPAECHLREYGYAPSLMTSSILIVYTSVDRSAINCSTLTLYTEDRQQIWWAHLFLSLN